MQYYKFQYARGEAMILDSGYEMIKGTTQWNLVIIWKEIVSSLHHINQIFLGKNGGSWYGSLMFRLKSVSSYGALLGILFLRPATCEWNVFQLMEYVIYADLILPLHAIAYFFVLKLNRCGKTLRLYLLGCFKEVQGSIFCGLLYGGLGRLWLGISGIFCGDVLGSLVWILQDLSWTI